MLKMTELEHNENFDDLKRVRVALQHVLIGIRKV